MNENELQNEIGTVSKTSADMKPQSPSDVSAAGDSATSVYAAGDFPGETDTDPVEDGHVKTAPGGSARANTDTDSVRPCMERFEKEKNDRTENEKTLSSSGKAITDGTTAEALAGNSTAEASVEYAAASAPLPHRDYEAEWKELADAHPEVVGTTLPEDIFQACIRSDQPPLRVYESMMLQRMQGELARLQQENDRLRQNHDNAQRAPVTGVMEGGAANVKEEDPFVAGFNRYR